MEIFFPGVPNQVELEITEIAGGGRVWQAPPWNGNSRRVGGLKQKCPGGEGMDIFWHYTVPSYYISFNRSSSEL